MQILSINVGTARPIDVGSVGQTGIFKEPANGSVFVSRNGLEGDAVCDAENHGGPDQAVMIYTQSDYDWWRSKKGLTVQPGLFGENLTVTDLQSHDVSVGDRLIFDDVVLEVTAPRIPCGTLAAKMEDPKFVKRFRRAERPGFYCRVLKEGHLTAADTFEYHPVVDDPVKLLELCHDYYEKDSSAEQLRRFLCAPIAIRARLDLESRLEEISRSS